MDEGVGKMESTGVWVYSATVPESTSLESS